MVYMSVKKEYLLRYKLKYLQMKCLEVALKEEGNVG